MRSAVDFQVRRSPIPGEAGADGLEVGGEMFACIGAAMPGVSVKTDSIEAAEMLIGTGVGLKAPTSIAHG